jgi:Mg/Co/Ni transporter MgtE
MAFLLINAAVCATFSGVFDRYQSRVAWLAALCATAFVCSWVKDRHYAKSLGQGL